jgi:selenocysteine lyase/cysteine desulfurase
MTVDAAERLSVADARRLWSPAGTYVNTASYGLPPEPGWRALQEALADWQGGRTTWEPWGESTERAREAFARLTSVEATQVAIGANVSTLVGLVACSLPAGARVVVPDVEFTSNLWPFVTAGHDVRTVPAHRLAEAIDASTDVVAFSAVQSATGEVADLDALATAARHHGALTVVDATQATGWLPFDASRFDAVASSAYKWLVSPRGTAFLALAPGLLERITPAAAGWYAGEDVHGSYYGLPMRLARTARRLDVSPAWFSWVGTAPALELFERIGIDAIHGHDVALANRYREARGLPPSNSAIVSEQNLGQDIAERLAKANIRAAVRAGALRTSWHVYNTPADVDRLLEALA